MSFKFCENKKCINHIDVTIAIYDKRILVREIDGEKREFYLREYLFGDKIYTFCDSCEGAFEKFEEIKEEFNIKKNIKTVK